MIFFFSSFVFTLGLQFPLRIWWSSVGHPWVHKASPGVLLAMAISLLSMPDGSCMSVMCGRMIIHDQITNDMHSNILQEDMVGKYVVLKTVYKYFET